MRPPREASFRWSNRESLRSLRARDRNRGGRAVTRQFAIVVLTICVVILFAGSSPGTAAPNAVPKLDTRPSCESPGRKAIAHTGSIQACMRSENEAHEELIKQWSQYAKTDRANCIGKVTKGGPPSYIELHSCLVTMKHVREIRKAHPHPSG